MPHFVKKYGFENSDPEEDSELKRSESDSMESDCSFEHSEPNWFFEIMTITKLNARCLHIRAPICKFQNIGIPSISINTCFLHLRRYHASIIIPLLGKILHLLLQFTGNIPLDPMYDGLMDSAEEWKAIKLIEGLFWSVSDCRKCGQNYPVMNAGLLYLALGKRNPFCYNNTTSDVTELSCYRYFNDVFFFLCRIPTVTGTLL